jgi:MFS family permease
MGSLIMALGFLSLGFLGSPLHYYVSYAFVGIGAAAIGPVSSTTVVSDWFLEKRGLAIGVTSTGIGFGGFVVAALVGALIIPSLGWRSAYFSIALMTASIIPLTLLIIKRRPIGKGFRDAGPLKNPERERNAGLIHSSKDISFRGALLSAPFWIIATAFMVSHFACVGVIQSQVPHLQDIGFPVAMAAAALGLLGMFSAVSKLFFGWLCDLIKPKYAFSVSVIFMACSSFILMRVGSQSNIFYVWSYSILMGFGAGSWVPTMSMLVSTNFGMVSYGAIFGAVMLAHSIGVSIGPLFAGYIYDTTQSYHRAFVIFMALYIISIPLMLALRRPDREERVGEG